MRGGWIGRRQIKEQDRKRYVPRKVGSSCAVAQQMRRMLGHAFCNIFAEGIVSLTAWLWRFLE
ncbi:hypothetical protein BJX62DRAFT_216680 [Aspergillus germanicus]